MKFHVLILLLMYIICKQLFLILGTRGVMSDFNLIIGYVICVVSLLILAPALDVRKLEGSINWVALICVMGLLYHVYNIVSGTLPETILLPFFRNDRVITESLMGTASVRPRSFFVEPQAYVSFIIVPLAIALHKKKFIWSSVLLISALLSLSTTGIAYAAIMVLAYLFTQKSPVYFKISAVVLSVLLFFAFTRMDFFAMGLNKLENTTADSDLRLYQGRAIVETMPSTYYLFGAPYSSVISYVKAGLASKVDLVTYGDIVFMPTFWFMIFSYGAVGFMLYALFYIKIFKHKKFLLPYLACLVGGLFTNTDGSLGAMFLFQLGFAYAYGKYHEENYCTT